MDEILASIRRIIADDDPMPRRPGVQAAAPTRAAAEPVRAVQPLAAPRAALGQHPNGQHSQHANGQRPNAETPAVQRAADYPPASEHSFLVDAVAELMEGEDMADHPYQSATPSQPAERRPEPVREHTAQRPAAARPPESREPSNRPFADQGRRKDLLSPDVGAAVSASFESLGAAVLPAHERTVEDLVKEILRPMLKTWLDDNLPRVVERLVRQEIERVSRAPR